MSLSLVGGGGGMQPHNASECGGTPCNGECWVCDRGAWQCPGCLFFPGNEQENKDMVLRPLSTTHS